MMVDTVELCPEEKKGLIVAEVGQAHSRRLAKAREQAPRAGGNGTFFAVVLQ